MNLLNKGKTGYSYLFYHPLAVLAVMAAIIGAVTAFVGGVFWGQRAKIEPVGTTYQVVKVLDGDSLVVPPDQSIRLARVNAPELKYCFGKEAKENLEELILGKRVRIEKLGIGKFNRLISLVYLGDQLINETVLANGWGKYTGGSKIKAELVERLKRAGHQAKEKQLGVWSQLCYQKTNPVNPKCNIKGNLGKHEHGAKKTYHYPGCSEYDRAVVELDIGEQWFCSEEEAQSAGYKKSEHCFRPYRPVK